MVACIEIVTTGIPGKELISFFLQTLAKDASGNPIGGYEAGALVATWAAAPGFSGESEVF